MRRGGRFPRRGPDARRFPRWGKKKQEPPTLDQIEKKLLDAGADFNAFIDHLNKSGIMDAMCKPMKLGRVLPPRRRRRPKPYRRHINHYKHLRERGTGILATWKPGTFRDYIQGWRQMVGMYIALAVVGVLYILYRVFLK